MDSQREGECEGERVGMSVLHLSRHFSHHSRRKGTQSTQVSPACDATTVIPPSAKDGPSHVSMCWGVPWPPDCGVGQIRAAASQAGWVLHGAGRAPGTHACFWPLWVQVLPTESRSSLLSWPRGGASAALRGGGGS